MKKVFSLMILIAVGSALCTAQTVQNGSFETGATPPYGGSYIPAPNSTAISSAARSDCGKKTRGKAAVNLKPAKSASITPGARE